MQCLNLERLESVSAEAFQRQQPFPWANPVGLLHPEAHEQLVASLPDVSLFERSFGVPRKFGQRSHDRYNLEYRPGIVLSDVWQKFIEELFGFRGGWALNDQIKARASYQRAIRAANVRELFASQGFNLFSINAATSAYFP